MESSGHLPGERISRSRGGAVWNALYWAVPVLLGVYVFLNPFPRKTAVELICFYGATTLALVLAATGRVRWSFRTPLAIPFLLFLAWSVLGLATALNPANSIHDVYAHLIQYLVLFYLLLHFFRTPRRFTVLCWIVAASGFLLAVGVMNYFYWFAGNPIHERLGIMLPFMEFIPGYLSYTSLLAVFVTIHLVGTVRHRLLRVLLALCLAGTALATALTQSRATFLAVLASLFVFSLRSRRNWLIWGIMALVIAVMIPSMKERMSGSELLRDGRIQIAMITFEVIKDHPVLGIGYGMLTYGDPASLDLAKYNVRLPEKYQQHHPGGVFWGSPHNTYLDIAVRTGLPGLALWILILAVAGRMAWQVMKRDPGSGIAGAGTCLLAALVGIAVQDLFMDGMLGPQIVLHYILFALIAILWHIRCGEPGRQQGQPGEVRAAAG
jgi:putative inorganic carbon (HCO3(-)) transporter